MKKTPWLAALFVAATAVFGLVRITQPAFSQEGADAGEKQPAHYQRLWNWLQEQDYTTWSAASGRSPEFEPGQSPHGALVKVYISPKTASDLENIPSGSVVVKENYNPEKKLMAITIMQRSKGYDPENGDWYYAKYLPDGKIDTMPPEKQNMPIAGKLQMCIDCHSAAGGGDYAFFND